MMQTRLLCLYLCLRRFDPYTSASADLTPNPIPLPLERSKRHDRRGRGIGFDVAKHVDAAESSTGSLQISRPSEASTAIAAHNEWHYQGMI